MAKLINHGQNSTVYLRGHHVIGRDPQYADLTLHTAGCSRVHAVIEWSSEGWLIRDLSLNGTWINGCPVSKREPVALSKGDNIAFGSSTSEPWCLNDATAPIDLLVGETAEARTLALEDYLLLPGDDDPYTLLFDAARGGWLLYSSSEPQEIGGPYTHGSEVIVAKRRWRLFLANAHSITPNNYCRERLPAQIHLSIRLSKDEEVTEIDAVFHGETHALGDRSHHYLVAHLARVKAAHIADGLDEPSAGWIEKEQLTRDLGVSSNHLNLQIHRAQKHVCDALRVTPKFANGLFEKRRGRVRLGVASCDVHKGGVLLAELRCSG
ncbi:FHA domain-containing protein [Congregibacter brevis]|uniref:FHA domain-containing protein n=1 Tax=Congregibacter brevis TaxID=3081201 RepID=A0ABZ0IGL6_9GAMM|nr:FHA domain-containing protein [Congregibacter sp. IMCC45268]